MKSLAILLLLASVAWGGEDTTSFALLSDDIVISPCANGFELVGVGVCEAKKGHCPHCGSKGIEKYSISLYSHQNGTDIYAEPFGKMCLCPNGHVFWEKGE